MLNSKIALSFCTIFSYFPKNLFDPVWYHVFVKYVDIESLASKFFIVIIFLYLRDLIKYWLLDLVFFTYFNCTSLSHYAYFDHERLSSLPKF